MNRSVLDRIAHAVLYEGYILYPYRPALKNRQRWTFGGLLPEAFCARNQSGDSSHLQVEVLIAGQPDTRIEAVVRFLHLTSRQVGQFLPPLEHWPDQVEPPSQPTDSLSVDGTLFQTWQEGEEREMVLGEWSLAGLQSGQHRRQGFPRQRRLEPLRARDERIAGVLIREQQSLDIQAEATAVPVSEGLFRARFRVSNTTPLADAALGREEALLRGLVSTHLLLGVEQGQFVSLMGPEPHQGAAAAACVNIGAWPVLVGIEGQRDTMLASPIILYDYPEVAPESPGDLFDGCEIDEILTLRILTLTDEEKIQAAAVDDRVRELLRRTEALGRDSLYRLHGTVRHSRPLEQTAGETS